GTGGPECRRERVTNCQGSPVGSLLTGEGEYEAQLAAVRHAVAEPELDPRQPARQVDDQWRVPRARERRLGQLLRSHELCDQVKVAAIKTGQLGRPPAASGEPLAGLGV